MSREVQTDWSGCLWLLFVVLLLLTVAVGGVVKFLAFWKVAFS